MMLVYIHHAPIISIHPHTFIKSVLVPETFRSIITFASDGTKLLLLTNVYPTLAYSQAHLPIKVTNTNLIKAVIADVHAVNTCFMKQNVVFMGHVCYK